MAKLSKSWIDKTKNPFNSSMLEVGEMMEITEGDYTGDVVIKMYNAEVYSLYDFKRINQIIGCIGRKLQSGESITLTQE